MDEYYYWAIDNMFRYARLYYSKTLSLNWFLIHFLIGGIMILRRNFCSITREKSVKNHERLKYFYNKIFVRHTLHFISLYDDDIQLNDNL